MPHGPRRRLAPGHLTHGDPRGVDAPDLVDAPGERRQAGHEDEDDRREGEGQLGRHQIRLELVCERWDCLVRWAKLDPGFSIHQASITQASLHPCFSFRSLPVEMIVLFHNIQLHQRFRHRYAVDDCSFGITGI